MRCLIANAAPVPFALKQEVVAKLGDGFLYEVYGSTELGIVTVLKPADQLRKPGSCGKVYGGIEVKLVSEDGTEADVGEPGELFIRTGLAMDGYHRTDEQLAELSDGGWKSVGDVAYRDDEGFLFINDRKKDMIISGGVNIYPAEIEAVLHEHPQVLDVAVFGIPDDEWARACTRSSSRSRTRRSTSRSCARSSRSASPGTSVRAGTSSATSCRGPTPASS